MPGADATCDDLVAWFKRIGLGQGFTLVHFSAQLKRFLWHKGCLRGG